MLVLVNLHFFTIKIDSLISFLDVHKPVFVATEEWQEIKEGQKVPSGLHYRMNLETGKKEAKLMETEDDKGMSNHLYIKGVGFLRSLL